MIGIEPLRTGFRDEVCVMEDVILPQLPCACIDHPEPAAHWLSFIAIR